MRVPRGSLEIRRSLGLYYRLPTMPVRFLDGKSVDCDGQGLGRNLCKLFSTAIIPAMTIEATQLRVRNIYEIIHICTAVVDESEE